MSKRVGWAAVGLAIVLVLAAGLWVSGSDRGAAVASPQGKKQAFCSSERMARDFGLAQLPRVREVPDTGDLPFGPKTVRLTSPGGRVLPIGASFGMDLHSENYSGRTPLGWTLRGWMYVVGRDGETGREVDSAEVVVPTISAGDNFDLSLEPLRRPGLYRYDLEIVDGDGTVLGDYSAHLKVFERTFWKARLGIDRDRAGSGARVVTRVENLGTETILFGSPFSVQRLEAGDWAGVPEATPEAWTLELRVAGPGAAAACQQVPLPRDLAPGRYRIVKEVGPNPWPRGKRSYFLTAPFKVVR